METRGGLTASTGTQIPIQDMDSASAILQQASGEKKKVCRNLFGPVDHEQLKKDSESAMANEVEVAKERWNFDFVTETPLEGSYKWKKVNFSEDVESNGSVFHERDQESTNTGSSDTEWKQTQMTDFYPVKRRRSHSPSPPTSPKP